jgi:hypothetical protein
MYKTEYRNLQDKTRVEFIRLASAFPLLTKSEYAKTDAASDIVVLMATRAGGFGLSSVGWFVSGSPAAASPFLYWRLLRFLA